tara:strand:- start:1132 stop:1482 length:351 start_codon:yes stop_codon:yes gene_type:complete
MSLFKSYTPKKLYLSTLRLVNSLFHVPPQVKKDPVSYFREVLNIHAVIRKDLKGILKEVQNPEKIVTVMQVHASLASIEQQLFGTTSEFDADIRGCCLYTTYLEKQLSTSSICTII